VIVARNGPSNVEEMSEATSRDPPFSANGAIGRVAASSNMAENILM
jgi:hypothetical protein